MERAASGREEVGPRGLSGCLVFSVQTEKSEDLVVEVLERQERFLDLVLQGLERREVGAPGPLECAFRGP